MADERAKNTFLWASLAMSLLFAEAFLGAMENGTSAAIDRLRDEAMGIDPACPPLYVLIVSGNSEMVERVLVDRVRDPVNVSFQGNSLLGWAIVSYYTARSHADLRSADYFRIIRLLLDHGADIMSVNSHNATALQYAQDLHLDDVVQLIQEIGYARLQIRLNPVYASQHGRNVSSGIIPYPVSD